ncbi:MAG: DUF6817 domain-containing protein [Pyrinomonadaceae bacterium]
MLTHNFNASEKYLLKLGTQLVFHSHANLHTHLVGVHHLLGSWGCPEHVALAGLFHSIYSTDEFRDFALPLTEREQIKGLIGTQGERLVYLYSAATRESWRRSAVSAEKPQLADRLSGGPLEVTEQEFTELLWLWLANNLDIKAREMRANGVGVLKRANFWHQVAERLGGEAVVSWQQVYGRHVGRKSDFMLEVKWHASRAKRKLTSRVKKLFKG